MKSNLGAADKIIRIIIAAGIAVLYFTNTITGTLATVLLVVAGILLLTAVISFCPIWYMLGIHTNKKLS